MVTKEQAYERILGKDFGIREEHDRDTPTYVGKKKSLRIVWPTREEVSPLTWGKSGLYILQQVPSETPPLAWGKAVHRTPRSYLPGDTPTCVGRLFDQEPFFFVDSHRLAAAGHDTGTVRYIDLIIFKPSVNF